MKNYLYLFLIFFSSLNLHAQKVYSVDYSSQADVKVFVADYESRADLIVYKVDYASRAEKMMVIGSLLIMRVKLIKKYILLIMLLKRIL